MPLSKKQQLFIDEYLIDLNATQAAIRAGYCVKRASDRGYQLCLSPLVQAQIAEKMAKRAQQLALDQNRVVLEIARLAFNDPRRAFAANGALLAIQDWPDEVAAAISSIKVHEIKDSEGNVIGECKEIKFWDKGKQLELAARHLGMLKDKLELSTPVSELIKAARERIRTD
ncbi:terminase small subunit [Methylomonas sp. AM2-LC]|uniref:terminase small subunit n=1 Tax=Methylomonas sp. AM2-LC TaxID=3153301 RepID=UPI003264CC16